MWFQHALYQPADYVAHNPLGFAPHVFFNHFHERITLTVEIDNTTVIA
jgi:hypothetical protein